MADFVCHRDLLRITLRYSVLDLPTLDPYVEGKCDFLLLYPDFHPDLAGVLQVGGDT